MDEPVAAREVFANKQSSGTIRHIVYIVYNGPQAAQWKPEIQQYILDKETAGGSTINAMSRITFDSFYDNAHLSNDQSLKMQLMETYGKVYGYKEAEALALKSVYKGALMQGDGKTIKAKFFVLYE